MATDPAPLTSAAEAALAEALEMTARDPLDFWSTVLPHAPSPDPGHGLDSADPEETINS